LKTYYHIHKQTGEQLPLKVQQCKSFFCRLRGLMFRRKLKPAEALLFEQAKESITAASIHMLFVFFPIAVIWLKADGTVVDTVLARPFRPYYAPAAPAKYFLEGPPFLLDSIKVGESFVFVKFDQDENLPGG
jgi:uncharacterized membrane protein (UPF0127 family)